MVTGPEVAGQQDPAVKVQSPANTTEDIKTQAITVKNFNIISAGSIFCKLFFSFKRQDKSAYYLKQQSIYLLAESKIVRSTKKERPKNRHLTWPKTPHHWSKIPAACISYRHMSTDVLFNENKIYLRLS